MVQGDHISDDLMGILVEKPIHRLESRIGDLLHVFADLDLGNHLPVLFQGGQFIDASKDRFRFRGNQPLPHSEGIHTGPLQQYILNDVLVQGIGNSDGTFLQSRFIQHLSGIFSQVGHVAAVDADSHLLGLHFLKHFDGVGYTGFQHIEGIHQQGAVFRIDLGIFFKGFIFGGEHLNPAVSHGSQGQDPVVPLRNSTGCSHAPADVGCPGSQYRCRSSVGSSGTEFHDGPSLGGSDNPVSLGGNQALVIDQKEKHGFHELGLYHRASYSNHRFSRKNRRSFGDSPYITGKFEFQQIIQEFFIEDLLAFQVIDIFLGKFQVLEIIHHLLQAGHNGETAPIGDLPEKEIKIGDVIGNASFKITIGHGQLIKVCQHGHIVLLFHFNDSSALPFSLITKYPDAMTRTPPAPCSKEMVSFNMIQPMMVATTGMKLENRAVVVGPRI